MLAVSYDARVFEEKKMKCVKKRFIFYTWRVFLKQEKKKKLTVKRASVLFCGMFSELRRVLSF